MSGDPLESWRSQVQHLIEQVRCHGLEIESQAADWMALYCHQVSLWNERSGLVSPHDLPFLVPKHLGASLGPLLIAQPRAGDRWIDVGTGGGLPGLVIKMARPEIQMVLLDSSRKKTLFLEHMVDLLPKPLARGVEIVDNRVENLDDTSFDFILMRAVGSLKKTLPYLDGIARPGVRLITFKGERLDTELVTAAKVMRRKGWVLEDQVDVPWSRPKLICLSRTESKG